MKKIFSYLAAAAMLFAVSCTEDNVGTDNGNEAQVTFNLSLEGQSGTRAIGDGTSVNKFSYAVFDAQNNLLTALKADKENAFANGSETVSLKLAKDQNYTVVFWAQHKDAPYTLSEDRKSVTINYKKANNENVAGNDETRDAFFKAEPITVTGSEQINVVLTRPFAQLNVGVTVDDFNSAVLSGVGIYKSWAKVTGVYNTLNLLDGTVDGETIAEFAMAKIPPYTEPLTVGNTEYVYLSMNYVLVGERKNVAAEFRFENEDGSKGINFNSGLDVIPVQRNYRTNLVGQILTGNLDFNVTIDADFNENDENVEVWNGTDTEAVTPNTEGDYEISKPEHLAWLAQVVNGTLPNTRAVAPESFAGKTFKLMNDVNLYGQNWTPIGTEENQFKGIFDGNGYTIRNLNIVETQAKEGKAFIGLFGYANNATIKNLTIENVNINIACLDIDHSQGHIGAVAGSLEGTSTIENVTIKGDIKVEATPSANGASRVAVVAGGNSYGNVTIKNVHVIANEGSYLKANNNVGAIAGQLQGKTVYENCSSNIDVTGTKFFAGGIVGLAGNNDTFTNCHTTGNISITAGRANDHYRVGGIAGGWADGKTKVCTLVNCSYTGEVSGVNSDGSVAEVLDYAGYVGRGYTLANCAGSKVVIDGVEYIQVSYDSNNIVYAVIKDGVCEVSTAKQLIAAVNVIEDGTTIKLTDDITFTEDARTSSGGGWYEGLYYVGDKSFTIDLNGKTIGQNGAVNDYLFFIKNDGAKASTFTFKNGTIDAGTNAYCAICTSSTSTQKITINLEDINIVGENSNGAVLKIRGGAELNVKAGTKITGKDNYTGIEAIGNGTVVNINEGVEIYQNGTSSYVGAIVGASYNATLNIYGGKGVSKKCGIIVMTTGATINVSGGEWTANGDGTIANDNNGVLVSQNNRYESGWACKSILNVTGGTFKGGYDCYGMGPGVEADDAQINISGGNFNANPSAYVVEGYKIKEGTTYEIVLDPAAKIGSTEYATLNEAFEVGGEITLLRNVTLSETATLEGDKTVVLDLNGKTVTAPLFSAFQANKGGKLTIKNGKVVAYESTVRAVGGEVVVESGEYISTGTALDSPATYRYSLDCREGGKITINGGTFKSNNGMINVSSEVVINGGKFENIVEKSMTRHFAYVSAKLTINDGEFYGKANGSAGGCFFCGAASGCDIQVNGGKFTSLWTSGSVNRIFEPYSGGTNVTVTGGMFNTNGGIANFVVANTDEATKGVYPYVAK